VLGAIADDFTGATDLACMLRRSGHRVAVVVDDGELDLDPAELDAVVVALKTRTIPPRLAVDASLAALARLRGWGAERIYVKYCSTFDSTAEGNIGPVLDAVADAMAASKVVVVPSLPENGRTVRDGLLHVGDVLLADSPMRDHPLTPMRDSRVSALLRPQTRSAVAEVHRDVVQQGPSALRRALDALEERYVVVDAVDRVDLDTIAVATATDPLISGGSGLALGQSGAGTAPPQPVTAPPGGRVVLCGSVSAATRGQIDDAAATRPVERVDVERAVVDVDAEVGRLLEFVLAAGPHVVPVVCAARTPDDVRARVHGRAVAPVVEAVLGGLALRLVDAGTRSIVVAGGESSGAVVQALGVQTLRIGAEVAPGVCWSGATTAAGHQVALVLKSGNFGAPDLFTTAWKELR
jgi:3-dehydrotetronate 4-kinase